MPAVYVNNLRPRTFVIGATQTSATGTNWVQVDNTAATEVLISSPVAINIARSASPGNNFITVGAGVPIALQVNANTGELYAQRNDLSNTQAFIGWEARTYYSVY